MYLSGRFALATCAAAATACALPAFSQAPADVNIGDPLALTFYVAPQNLAAAEAKAQSLQTPGSPDYRKFLTLQQFVQGYAVSDAQLASIEASLQNLGFTIGEVYPNHLAIEVLGSVGTAQSALGVEMKRFTRNGVTGLASTRLPTLPPELKGLIRGVGGLNTVTHARPMHLKGGSGQPSVGTPVKGLLTGGTSGHYLPLDFAKQYDLLPIYEHGITGRGSTVGIVTLNTFNTADAFTFWQGIGLNEPASRITKVNVDGGETASSNNSDGEGETDLDVEYSGALAPGADVRVYIAPNQSFADFLNGFEAAASENIADTVSTSWDQPELDFFYDTATGTPADTSLLDTFHDIFVEMALQGQTVYVAAGDSGSFDTVRDCPIFGTPTPDNPVCNAPYAVDSPANDPYVTAAGGTTLPLKLTFKDGTVVSVPAERAWSWDYIASAAAAQGHGADITLDDVFSVGGGGGVSSYFNLPWYQTATPGITATKDGQFFAADFGAGAVVQNILPGSFAGRNMPDISADADPYSGYQLVEGGVSYTFNGGTSFVAPQLNGVTGLFVQYLGGRVGQINPALYQLSNYATTDILQGDNWGYAAGTGYDNAAGLGSLDATKLLLGLQLLPTL